MAGVSNNRKQWIEGISDCITFFYWQVLQVDDKQPNYTASISPHCDDTVSDY